MIIRKKKFDCVESKWQIQEQIDKEYQGLTEAEKKKQQFARLLANPRLSKFAKHFPKYLD